MSTTSGWTARIGEDAARLRLAYVASWAGSVLVLIALVVSALLRVPSAPVAGAWMLGGLLVIFLALSASQVLVGRTIRTRLQDQLSVPANRRFPLRTLLNQSDYDRWVASLRG